ncbi:energy-coupling factor ABC transporter ATP-binding protein [Pelagicoccus sp. SDUM812005]|uniref:ABC transporter ATP-binding protein n=1 Tax=Pelagicoccus sp. SDUM812005 TaxID=3041257 RepID=UPI00280F9FE4|nr:energy-coupling factor ABC transporter ATP-binding protein [Pelagicoccus sp. SDUM812005]MDQ8181376.1 energy-coupling factor ABC transporter ATP-binding protein [Pelagicoccus sp. SDUM812005]
MLKVVGLSFLDWEPVSLEVEAGEIVCAQGESGSGKSLLLRAIADLIPHTGEVYLHGDACSGILPTKWRREVSFLAAEALWWEDRVGAHFLSEVSPERLEGLGLAGDCMDWPVSRLSMGERQRLGILRLLDRQPRVLLLDEPTSNLDARSSGAVESLLREYMEGSGACSIWVTHDEGQAERIGGRRFYMGGKRLEELAR